MKIMKICVLLLALPPIANAQLFIGPNSKLYVQTGDILQVDSLALTPSSTLVLANNKIIKTSTPEWAPGINHASIKQVYTIDTPFNFQGTASIVYATNNLNGNTAASLALLFAPLLSDSLRLAPTSTVNIATHTVTGTFSGPTRTGKFSAGNSATPLPIELMSFNAWLDHPNRVRLTWESAAEHNCAGYIIQRSPDGQRFSDLLFATSKGANGLGATYITYDNAAVLPLNYYRLASQNVEGKLTYHGIRKVERSQPSTDLIITTWPQPVQEDLHISFSRLPLPDAELTLYDIGGRILMQAVPDTFGIAFSMKGLPSGIYALRYKDGSRQITARIEKL